MIRKLFNPFTYIAGGKALVLGSLAILVSSVLAGLTHTRFDGAIDAHYGGNYPFYFPLMDQLLGLVIVAGVFYLLATVLSKGKTRLIDMLGTVALSRYPYILLPLLNLGGIQEETGKKILGSVTQQSAVVLSPAEITWLVVTGIVALLIIAWFITLLYRAYTVSSNLKGARAIVSFIAGLLIAEACTFILIHTFLL